MPAHNPSCQLPRRGSIPHTSTTRTKDHTAHSHWCSRAHDRQSYHSLDCKCLYRERQNTLVSHRYGGKGPLLIWSLNNVTPNIPTRSSGVTEGLEEPRVVVDIIEDSGLRFWYRRRRSGPRECNRRYASRCRSRLGRRVNLGQSQSTQECTESLGLPMFLLLNLCHISVKPGTGRRGCLSWPSNHSDIFMATRLNNNAGSSLSLFHNLASLASIEVNLWM